MNIIKKINNYIFENDYKLTITEKYINIINYEEIINFSLNKIDIRCNKCIISIEGKDLIISKMLNEEVLIKGTPLNISIKEH